MYKQAKKIMVAMIIIVIAIDVWQNPMDVSAWSDNGGGRPSYTQEEITSLNAEGKWNNKIVFNSISNSSVGDEKNFVGARACKLVGSAYDCGGATDTTVWNANEIKVEDGKTYIVRAYVHNNNPNGYKGVAKDTKVSFNVPVTSAKEIEISGHISSSNATPTHYEDDVVLKSDTPFHLEYVYGSALLENQKVAKGGLTLSDEIVNAKDGGVLIGYDSLNGEVPGCYKYDNFVTIQVKVVYDYNFTVEQQVRRVGDTDKTWKDAVDVKVGDKVEFQIQYKNTSDSRQETVAIKETLPENLRYIPGSTYLKNASHPKGDLITEDYLVTTGMRIGNYGAGANAYIKFTAEVVDEELEYGKNTLISWGQAGANGTTRCDSASVTLTKKNPLLETVNMILSTLLAICLLVILVLLCKTIKLKKTKKLK